MAILLTDGQPFNHEPVIRDQNGWDDLIMADMLLGRLSRKPSEHVSGLKLTHANVLLDFEMSGVPEGMTLRVSDLRFTFEPFQYQEGRYMAIVTGDWFAKTSNSIALLSDAGTYIHTETIKGEQKRGNTIYSFKAI